MKTNLHILLLRSSCYRKNTKRHQLQLSTRQGFDGTALFSTTLYVIAIGVYGRENCRRRLSHFSNQYPQIFTVTLNRKRYRVSRQLLITSCTAYVAPVVGLVVIVFVLFRGWFFRFVPFIRIGIRSAVGRRFVYIYLKSGCFFFSLAFPCVSFAPSTSATFNLFSWCEIQTPERAQRQLAHSLKQK